MSDTAQLLASLRDVTEPAPPAGAPLWLLGANLLALSAVLLLLWLRSRRRRYGWRKQLIDDLRHARQLPPEQGILTAATALRQLSLATGEPVHTVNGERWLQHLDKQFNTQWFTHAEGRLLGDTLYRRNNIDAATVRTMLEELEQLIKSLSLRPVPVAPQ